MQFKHKSDQIYHKLFPSYIHSQITQYGNIENAAYLVLESSTHSRVLKTPTQLKSSSNLKILHYLYLNGIDVHLLSKIRIINKINYRSSIYTKSKKFLGYKIQYLKVISQDFDYLQNEHDEEAYRKPSFWKEIHNNNGSDEQSIRVSEWKNRFDEHVLHHLSKMIQEWMLIPNQHFME